MCIFKCLQMGSSLPSTSENFQDEYRIDVPVGGNSFVTQKGIHSAANVLNNGWKNWSDNLDVFSVYFKINKSGILKLHGIFDTVQNGTCKISCTLIPGSSIMTTISNSTKEYLLGEWITSSIGYICINFQGVSKTTSSFSTPTKLYLSGSAVDENTIFVKNNEGNMFHWGRRGPSVHLNYYSNLNFQKHIEWFYSEVTVPKGNDVIGSFFMANGFGEGYFGIQVNSETERRILFSVWSPCDTDDPSCIPEEQKIRCLKYGDEVTICEFGCEGSGGQSFLRYNWKTDTPYKFLLHAQPDLQSISTTYTAYFYAPELSTWLLIACLKRPRTQTWFRNLHSFIENFIPETGFITRKAYFHNQWIKSVDGEWIPLAKAKFTGDETARNGFRVDYDGGIENGQFYLKHCGFFSDKNEKLDTILTKNSTTNKLPEINFNELE